MAAATASVRPVAATRAEVSGRIDPHYAALYRAAGGGAILTALLIPLQVVAFIVWPLPEGGAADWFAVFRENPIRGLVSYDVLILLEEVLLIPIVLALFVLLERGAKSTMAVAAAMWLLSIALFIGANTGFEMLTLATRHAEAADEAARSAYLATGEGMLAGYMGNGTSFVMGYLLATIAGLLVGAAMLRSPLFHRGAAWAVIVANVLGFGLFLPNVGILLSLVSVLILVAWYALVGWRLVRLPRELDG
jgi:hypothetical protein